MTAPGIRHARYDGPLGGGSGMPSGSVPSEGDADVVVESGNLQAGVDSASSGETVYVSGSAYGGAVIDTPGVTVAGNRGIGSDGHVSGTISIRADNVTLDGLTVDLEGGHPALEIDGRDPLFFNCEFFNIDGPGQGSQAFSHGAINDDIGPRATWRQCTIRDVGHETYGWHHGYGGIWQDASVIEYCDIYDMGRHVGSCGRTRYHIRDNHIHGQNSASVAGNDHVWEFRANPEECGEHCGNAVIEHNVNECSGPNGNRSSLARIRGTPSEEIRVEYNWSPGSTPPTGGCEANGTHGGYDRQIVMQSRSPHDSFENVVVRNNSLDTSPPPDHGGNGGDDPDPDRNSLVFESTDATPHVWAQVQSSSRIEPGPELDVGASGQIDEIYQTDDGRWVGNAEFGPLGADGFRLQGKPAVVAVFHVSDGTYTEDPVPESDYRLLWNGQEASIDDIVEDDDDGGGDDDGDEAEPSDNAAAIGLLLGLGGTVSLAHYYDWDIPYLSD